MKCGCMAEILKLSSSHNSKSPLPPCNRKRIPSMEQNQPCWLFSSVEVVHHECISQSLAVNTSVYKCWNVSVMHWVVNRQQKGESRGWQIHLDSELTCVAFFNQTQCSTSENVFILIRLFFPEFERTLKCKKFGDMETFEHNAVEQHFVIPKTEFGGVSNIGWNSRTSLYVLKGPALTYIL